MHGSGERGRRGGLAGARLEMHAELAQNILRVGEDIHQMRDGCALVTHDIADAALEQRLGDGEDALTAEFFARTDAELFDFLRE